MSWEYRAVGAGQERKRAFVVVRGDLDLVYCVPSRILPNVDDAELPLAAASYVLKGSRAPSGTEATVRHGTDVDRFVIDGRRQVAKL